MDNQSYTWTDNPTVSGVSPCNTDVLNECLMHLKYNQEKGDGFKLFDIKITDRKLVGVEAVGWMLQGGLVTMTYPDAVNQIIQEFDEGATVSYRGINCVQALNGHYVADIAQKDAIDKLFAQTGIAEFYILDKTNQQFYLPRNSWFMQFSTDDNLINQFKEAGLPNIYGTVWSRFNAGTTLWNDSVSGAFYTIGTGAAEQRGDGGATERPAGLGINAAQCSSVYGRSSTVQPQAGTKLLYYKVGNITTDVNQILIDAQKFLEDSSNQLQNSAKEGLETLENAKDEGVIAINNASNALKQTQISNCVLQTPDLIKYGLENNSFILKAGSVVLVPYGTSAPEYEIGGDLNGGKIVDISWDGSKLFYYVQYDTDKTIKSTVSTESQFLYIDEHGVMNYFNEIFTHSGKSAPTSIQNNCCIYYDTTNNIVKVTTNNGTSWTQNNSLPICLLKAVKDVGYTSVMNIFNTGGYIYKAIWVNKNVKGLIPNGLNADGSLCSIEYKTEYTAISEFTGVYQDEFNAYITDEISDYISQYSDRVTFYVSNLTDLPAPNVDKYYRIYVINENKWFISTNGNPYQSVQGFNIIWFKTNASGKITNFKTSMPYRAMNLLDTDYIANMGMPSKSYINLSLGANHTQYTAIADGWFYIDRASLQPFQYVGFCNATDAISGETVSFSGQAISQHCSCLRPVKKGETVAVIYSGDAYTAYFRFIYAQGAIQ